MFKDTLPQAALGERRLAGQHVVGGAAQRIDVAADVGGPAVARLLRRQVVDGAHRGAVLRHLEVLIALHQRQPEIRHLDHELVARAGQQEVRRLDVPVDNALSEGVVEGPGGLHQDAPRLLRLEPALALDVGAQVDAVDEFEGEVMQVLVGVVAALVQGHDVPVVEPGGVAGFAAEALEYLPGVGQVRGEHFQGDGAAQLQVHRLVNGAHAPGRDVGQHLVLAEAIAGVEDTRRHAQSCSVPTGRTVRNGPAAHDRARWPRGVVRRTQSRVTAARPECNGCRDQSPFGLHCADARMGRSRCLVLLVQRVGAGEEWGRRVSALPFRSASTTPPTTCQNVPQGRPPAALRPDPPYAYPALRSRSGRPIFGSMLHSAKAA